MVENTLYVAYWPLLFAKNKTIKLSLQSDIAELQNVGKNILYIFVLLQTCNIVRNIVKFIASYNFYSYNLFVKHNTPYIPHTI